MAPTRVSPARRTPPTCCTPAEPAPCSSLAACASSSPPVRDRVESVGARGVAAGVRDVGEPDAVPVLDLSRAGHAGPAAVVEEVHRAGARWAGSSRRRSTPGRDAGRHRFESGGGLVCRQPRVAESDSMITRQGRSRTGHSCQHLLEPVKPGPGPPRPRHGRRSAGQRAARRRDDRVGDPGRGLCGDPARGARRMSGESTCVGPSPAGFGWRDRLSDAGATRLRGARPAVGDPDHRPRLGAVGGVELAQDVLDSRRGRGR
jgi:hypothetical protein